MDKLNTDVEEEYEEEEEEEEEPITEVDKEKINRLAWLFYKMHGYEVEIGYDFSTAVHPQEKSMFELAKVSKQFWGTQ